MSTLDNPYYFYNDPKSPRTPDSQCSGKSFSFFKRRNSKGSSPRPILPEQQRLITSANLDKVASLTLGCSCDNSNSSNHLAKQCFELQALKPKRESLSLQEQEQLEALLPQGIHCPNSNTETPHERLSSCRHLQAHETRIFTTQMNDDSNKSPRKSLNSGERQSQLHHTIPTTADRRHSFSNWRHASELNKKTIAMPNSDEVPQMMAPRRPLLSPNKSRYASKRGGQNNIYGISSNSSITSPSGYCNMDDILIVTAKHSERSILRANFLKNHFDKITSQRGCKPFNFLHIRLDAEPFGQEVVNKYQNAALQIIILCPALLAMPHSVLMTQLSAIVRVDKVFAILLDITEEKVLDIHKAALPNYQHWRRYTMEDNDNVHISNIMGIATDILGRALCQRPICHDSGNSMQRYLTNSSDEFSILPRKVKIGQNKVVAILVHPMKKDDNIQIIVEKSEELIEIRNFKCRNPYTIQFAIPEDCMEISTIIEVRIKKNDENLGVRPIKCESRLREMEQLLRTENSPIEFMCNALGIGPSKRDDLDLYLLQCFQKNLPTNFHLLNDTYEKAPKHESQRPHQLFMSMRDNSPEEYPTLLHFAAKWGLTRLCMQLLESPGGDTACGIRNKSGKSPAELAEMEGHHKLAQNIISFTEFHELTTMYHYFKGISNNNNNNSNCVGRTNENPTKLDNSQNSKVVLEAIKKHSTSSKCKEPKATTNAKSNQTKSHPIGRNEQDFQYMDMSSSSDRENTPEVKNSNKTLAVSNLNYISVETENENLQDFAACKSLDINKVAHITGAEITSNELLITELPVHTARSQNTSETAKNDTDDSIYPSDKFSHECSKLLEDYNATTAFNDYVTQPSNIPLESKSPANISATSKQQTEEEHLLASQETQNNLDSPTSTFDSLKTSVSHTSTTSNSSNVIYSTKIERSNVDDELAEIMYDFKNNVLSICEVEVLVEKWKHRNDVQQSFRQKLEHIDQLRKDYERIQEQVRDQLKRDTPFDKFKKLFSRQKTSSEMSIDKHCCRDNNLDEHKSSVVSSSAYKTTGRPNSSLSLQSVSSSSSSGRLSTGSNCSGTSLGDSGTHSDHDERRFGCRLTLSNSMSDNYLVPPPPRPVFTPVSTPGDEKHPMLFPSLPSLCSHLNSPSSPIDIEHYQIFPSNIPVNAIPITTASSLTNNYLNTIMEAKHETEIKYQNHNMDFNINDQRNLIVYGKLNKPSNNCSSFKPPTKRSDDLQNNYVEVEAEVYKNIDYNNLDKKYTDTDNSINTKENLQLSNEIGEKHKDDNHNYMNC